MNKHVKTIETNIKTKKQLMLQGVVVATILQFPLFVIAGESGIDSDNYPSAVDYFQYKEDTTNFSNTNSFNMSNTVYMNGNGNDWYSTSGGITAVYGGGGDDRSVEKFYHKTYSQVPWYWATSATVHVQMDDNGSKAYRCPDNHVVTELWYRDEGDDSVEALRCRAMRSLSTSSESEVIIPYSGTAYCPSNKYLTGMRYKDYGDDYVESILCSAIN